MPGPLTFGACTCISVTVKNKDLVSVGGPNKGRSTEDLQAFVTVLRVYKDQTRIEKVGVKVYLLRGTPPFVFDAAIQMAGKQNVFKF